MTAKHRAHSGALSDLAEIIAYLGREAPDQAVRLKMLYRDARLRLRRQPLVNAPLLEGYRRVVLVPFKYMIVYVTDGHNTDILAVLDARRNLETIRATLRGRAFE